MATIIEYKGEVNFDTLTFKPNPPAGQTSDVRPGSGFMPSANTSGSTSGSLLVYDATQGAFRLPGVPVSSDLASFTRCLTMELNIGSWSAVSSAAAGDLFSFYLTDNVASAGPMGNILVSLTRMINPVAGAPDTSSSMTKTTGLLAPENTLITNASLAFLWFGFDKISVPNNAYTLNKVRIVLNVRDVVG